ncbi:transposase, IS4 family protein [Pseudomonas putida TRO1]|uniref:Transposase InsH N-terminal domain-containing protein n=2 Tax=Pseudomonas putida TaxID=303 RepID=A0A2S3WKM6_PSEPU|nr:transposase, IS4 family protein [Pseudomonas putida TRO1]KYC17385.1 hypothetical protein WM94_21870 [Pseudomonas sp. ABFPK]POF85066.1 hypothetical protein BGP81_22035 [Pseudomonas putida]POF99753.1 hypothetical protein BGP82_28360 [Pseudomonas putida]
MLAEIEPIVPRIELVALVEPHYPKVGGRKSYSLESMPRIHLLQNGFSLRAPAMEEALHEITLMGRLARLTLSAPIPEDITIMNFRDLLKGISSRQVPGHQAKAQVYAKVKQP